jgi:hypothetical protein
MAKQSNPSEYKHQSCIHHWLCGDEQQGVVHAVCAKCGAETDFVQHGIPTTIPPLSQGARREVDTH